MSRRPGPALDRELAHLPPGARWREWMARVEAVLFAAPAPVPRADLARVVGQGASVETLVADLAEDLRGRPFEVMRIAQGWQLRTRPAYGPAIRAAAGIDPRGAEPRAGDVAVLAAIATRQPVTRDELKEAFGRDVPRALLGRLAARGLIAPGPRSPAPGAPRTYVTTDAFLALFGLASLDDIPDPADPDDAGMAGESGTTDDGDRQAIPKRRGRRPRS